MKDPKRYEEEIDTGAVPGTPVNRDVIDPSRFGRRGTSSLSPHHSPRSALRSELFLGLLVLTLLNAVVFLHYARTRQAALDLKQANLIVKTEMGRDGEYYLPVADFIAFHGGYSSQTDSLFASSLAKFRGRLTRFGIDASDLFEKDDFQRRNRGLYWSPFSRDDTLRRPTFSE